MLCWAGMRLQPRLVADPYGHVEKECPYQRKSDSFPLLFTISCKEDEKKPHGRNRHYKSSDYSRRKNPTEHHETSEEDNSSEH